MDFKLDKKPKYKIEIYGQTYELAKPQVCQIAEFKNKMSAKEHDEIELTQEFISKLGIPLEVIKEMDADDFGALVEFITNPKKK